MFRMYRIECRQPNPAALATTLGVSAHTIAGPPPAYEEVVGASTRAPLGIVQVDNRPRPTAVVPTCRKLAAIRDQQNRNDINLWAARRVMEALQRQLADEAALRPTRHILLVGGGLFESDTSDEAGTLSIRVDKACKEVVRLEREKTALGKAYQARENRLEDKRRKLETKLLKIEARLRPLPPARR